jgi:hypothetical protein
MDTRNRQNVAALIFLIIIAVGGTLLFLAVGRSAAVLDCLTAGFRNCGQPLDADSRQ